jgi:hypothetical protein
MSGNVPTDDPAGAGGAVPTAAEPATQPPPAIDAGAVAAPEPVGSAPEPAPEPAAPAAEAAPAEPETPAVTPHTETETLLETAGKPPEGEKPAEAAPEAPKPPARTYEDFTLPEGFTVEPEKLSAFHEVLSAHNLDQEAGQKLVDMHTANLRTYAENLAAEQHRVFANTRAEWRKEIMADEQLGGSGHQTTLAAVARMRDLLVPEQHKEAFNNFLRVTGAGDHPEFLRVLHNAARLFDEPAAPSHQPVNPPPNLGRAPGRARFNYDHPSSAKARS